MTRLPTLTADAQRDDYGYRFTIRQRKSARQMTPDELAAALDAAASQLETWAGQMREEIELLLTTPQPDRRRP